MRARLRRRLETLFFAGEQGKHKDLDAAFDQLLLYKEPWRTAVAGRVDMIAS